MEVVKGDEFYDEEHPDLHSKEVKAVLGKIIKHSSNITHLNLSGTGLSESVIHDMGTFMRRSRTV